MQAENIDVKMLGARVVAAENCDVVQAEESGEGGVLAGIHWDSDSLPNAQSIKNPLRIIGPGLHYRPSLFKRAVFHGDLAGRDGFFQFVVQPVVTKADGCGFGAAVGEDDALDLCPVGGGEAHGAGFAGGVEGAAGEVKLAGFLAGSADGIDFCVGGGVVVDDDTVPGFSQDKAVADDQRTKWPAIALLAPFLGEFNGAGEENFIRIHGLGRGFGQGDASTIIDGYLYMGLLGGQCYHSPPNSSCQFR